MGRQVKPDTIRPIAERFECVYLKPPLQLSPRASYTMPPPVGVQGLPHELVVRRGGMGRDHAVAYGQNAGEVGVAGFSEHAQGSRHWRGSWASERRLRFRRYGQFFRAEQMRACIRPNSLSLPGSAAERRHLGFLNLDIRFKRVPPLF
jgi:hypothetical protein